MKDLTIEQAYELAVKKWEWIVEHNGRDRGIEIAIPELPDLYSWCSYCELFIMNKPVCKGCPLRPKRCFNNDNGCSQFKHPYRIWYDNPSRETAQAVLDLIIKTKPF